MVLTVPDGRHEGRQLGGGGDGGGVGRLDGGRVLAGQHGPRVNGLALREDVGLGLAGGLGRTEPLEGGGPGGAAVLHTYLQLLLLGLGQLYLQLLPEACRGAVSELQTITGALIRDFTDIQVPDVQYHSLCLRVHLLQAEHDPPHQDLLIEVHLQLQVDVSSLD